MMKAEVREAGALKQYVTGSFLARTWARGANASEIELMDAETVRGQSGAPTTKRRQTRIQYARKVTDKGDLKNGTT
jgi:hypothetical protein